MRVRIIGIASTANKTTGIAEVAIITAISFMVMAFVVLI